MRPQADALYYLCVKNKGYEKGKESNGGIGADSSGGRGHSVVVFKHKQSVERENGGRHRCSCGLYAGRGQLCRVYAPAATEETGQPGAALHGRRCRVSVSVDRRDRPADAQQLGAVCRHDHESKGGISVQPGPLRGHTLPRCEGQYAELHRRKLAQGAGDVSEEGVWRVQHVIGEPRD